MTTPPKPPKKQEPEKAKMIGQRRKYETHVLPNIEQVGWWKREGVEDQEIAKRLGVSVATYYQCAKDYVEFSEALKKDKAYWDQALIDALLLRARGQTVKDVTTTIKWRLVDGELAEVSRDVKEGANYIPPDTGALCFAMTNRMRGEFQHRKAIALEAGEGFNPIHFHMPGEKGEEVKAKGKDDE